MLNYRGYWRDHPSLQGRFHEEFPDDMQVYVHDGGPRLIGIPPEYIWVRVTGFEMRPFGDVFRGTVLNQPHHLKTVAQHQPIQFVVPDGFPYPVMVTEKYFGERELWQFSICPHCGMSEMLDAPSDFRQKVFPHAVKATEGGQVSGITFGMLCPACGGVMIAKQRESPDDPYVFTMEKQGEPRTPFAIPYRKISADQPQQAEDARPRKWWQFWR